MEARSFSARLRIAVVPDLANAWHSWRSGDDKLHSSSIAIERGDGAPYLCLTYNSAHHFGRNGVFSPVGPLRETLNE